MELLNDNGFSNPIRDKEGHQYLFVRGTNQVLVRVAQGKLPTNFFGTFGLFGVSAQITGHTKRPFTQEELHWMANHLSTAEFMQRLRTIWVVYSVNWAEFVGSEIPGCSLRLGSCFSSDNLADCTLSYFAVDTAKSSVVGYLHSSYWIEDRFDLDYWQRSLRADYPAVKEAIVA